MENKKKTIAERIGESKINYFSDLFIVAMVVMWIVYCAWSLVIASAVTISSIVISVQNGCQNFDTSMWEAIGSNVVLPLASGGALWMIKNAVQHAIANSRGEECEFDFPDVSQCDDM